MADAFSTLAVIISDGNTVPSIDLDDEKVYVNIGSGTVLKLSWETPTASGNILDYYNLYIYTYDTSGVCQTILDTNIGNVNEFYITADLLASEAYEYCKLYIQLTAVSKLGNFYNGTSEIVRVIVSKGCGTYVKVEKGYPKPIMKRALAFAKLNYVLLYSADGKVLRDVDEKALYAKSAKIQDTNIGWALMQEFHIKDSDDLWENSDIQYEILIDENNELITDVNNEPIYTL
jgi:hypothetical protein